MQIAGSVSGAVFLSQALFWNERASQEDGFFYKTAEEWEAETGIPQRTQDRIRAVLRSKKILIEKLCGVPATLYFHVDEDALLELLQIRQVAKLDSPSGETRFAKNDIQDSPSGETFTSSETTTENTSESPVTSQWEEFQERQKLEQERRAAKGKKPKTFPRRQYSRAQNGAGDEHRQESWTERKARELSEASDRVVRQLREGSL